MGTGQSVTAVPRHKFECVPWRRSLSLEVALVQARPPRDNPVHQRNPALYRPDAETGFAAHLVSASVHLWCAMGIMIVKMV